MADWRKELREITRRFPTGSETEDLLRAIMETESDRGCALIAGSMVENALEGIITTHLMRNLNRARRSELFGPEGVLSSFSAKVKIAFAFLLMILSVTDSIK